MKSTISTKTGLILLLPALAAVAMLWAFSSFLGQVKVVAPYTDIAGRQRMLSVQLRKYAYMVHIGQQKDRGELRALINRFGVSLDVLQHGGRLSGQDADLPPPPDDIIPDLTTVARFWLPLKSKLSLIADLPEDKIRARRIWEEADTDLPKLTMASNAVVKAFVAYDMRLHRHMGLLLASNAVFALLLFIGGFWIARRFIVRPVRQLVDTTAAMTGGDYSWRLDVRGHDELASLMASYNTMADAITSAIDRERELRHQQEVIAETVVGLSRELASEAVLRNVGEMAMQITGARYAMLSWLKGREKQFIPLGMDDETLAKLHDHPPQGLGLLSLLWNQRQVVRVNNIAGHPASYGFPKDHPAMQTMLGAPIEFSGEVIGALYLCDKKDKLLFSKEDEDMVRMLASACAVALSNANQFERLKQASKERVRRIARHTREIQAANRLLHNHEIELELANDELRNANEAKNQFLANTSHELRTPLNAIIGFSDLLLTARSQNMPAKQKEYVAHINTSGKRLLTLINSLLDLSKIEAGMLEINEEAGSASIVLDHIIHQISSLAGKKKLELHVVKPEDEHAVFIDTGKLQQVWVNLIGNAIKFTPEGGHIEAGFDIRTGDADGEAVLEGYVQDTGIGLNTADIERIFEPFVQAEGGLTREFGGTGLGLALVRRLLGMQGGTIHVKSRPGKGSRFTFTLPVRMVAVGERHLIPATIDSGLPEALPSAAVEVIEEEVREVMELPLILIIDDDKARAATVSSMLEAEGYQSEMCDLDQVERLVEEKCPFIFMVGMPDDPVDIYRRMHLLRSRKATRNIPLVLLGGDAEAPHFSLGTVDTVDKQMSRNDLMNLISRHGRHIPMSNIMTVLVVDDEVSVREYIREALHGQGYRILLAANGRDGLKAAIEHEPDLIILDLMMPGMSGFEVVEELKRHPTACDIPVVIFTAKDLTRGEVMQLAQEVEKVLTKGMTSRTDLLRELRSLELLYPVRARLMDSVLHCYNLRYKQLRLAQECSRFDRYGHQFSLVGWEMDGFDGYVREHGQRWGVAALKDTVDLVNAITRKGDVLVRSGESAFTLILPGIKPPDVERAAEKIRMRIRLHRFPLAGGEAGHFTASLGCAHLNKDAVDPDDLLTRLHARIAQARKAGGDCCTYFDEEGE